MAGTVTVCSKLPYPLVIQGERKIETTEPSPTGGRPVTKYIPAGPSFEARGVAHPFGHQPPGLLNNGFALTHGIDADAWAAFAEKHRETDFIINRLVFAFAKESDAQVETRKMEDVRSGLEPIDPQRLDREFRGIGGKLSPLQQAPESNKPRPV